MEFDSGGMGAVGSGGLVLGGGDPAPVHRLSSVLVEIQAERNRQDRLKQEGRFRATCADPMPEVIRLAVLMEEVGEVAAEVYRAAGLEPDPAHLSRRIEACGQWAREMNEQWSQREPQVEVGRLFPEERRRIRKELIQVAAVCQAWVEGLDLEG